MYPQRKEEEGPGVTPLRAGTAAILVSLSILVFLDVIKAEWIVQLFTTSAALIIAIPAAAIGAVYTAYRYSRKNDTYTALARGEELDPYEARPGDDRYGSKQAIPQDEDTWEVQGPRWVKYAEALEGRLEAAERTIQKLENKPEPGKPKRTSALPTLSQPEPVPEPQPVPRQPERQPVPEPQPDPRQPERQPVPDQPPTTGISLAMALFAPKEKLDMIKAETARTAKTTPVTNTAEKQAYPEPGPEPEPAQPTQTQTDNTDRTDRETSTSIGDVTIIGWKEPNLIRMMVNSREAGVDSTQQPAYRPTPPSRLRNIVQRTRGDQG